MNINGKIKMNQKISIAPYGPILNFKKGYTAQFVEETIKQLNLDGLRVFADLKHQKLESLDFLRDYTFLKVLDIMCIDEHDYSFLNNLSNLKGFSLGQSVTEKNIVDLSNLQNLERISLHWRKNKIVGLDKCIKLEYVGVSSFKEKDLTKFQNLLNVEELRIATGSMQSLEGVQNLKNLKKIAIGNCRYLKSIKQLNGLPNLRVIEIGTSSKVEDYESLTNLPQLEELKINHCKQIKSIKFVKNLLTIKKIVIGGNTKILDGDVKPAQHIDYVFITQWKYYNMISKNSKEEKEQEMLKRYREQQGE